MRNIRWAFALILIGITAISVFGLYSINPASAQKPGAPTFTVSVTNSTSTTPTTITIDPYTGANVTNVGHTTVSVTVTVTIQNTPQVTAYLLGIKGHYSTVWQYPWQDEYNITAFASSDSQTVITFSGNNASGAASNQIFFKYSNNDGWGFNVPFGGKLDFQLQAVNGQTPIRVLFGYEVIGGVTGWSTVQTVDIPDFAATSTISPEPTYSPSPTPTIPESTAAIDIPRNAPHLDPIYYLIPVGVIAVIIAVSLVIFRKHQKTRT